MPTLTRMALTPEQERSINEDLLSQVNADNVLKAAQIYQRHADDIDYLLLKHKKDLVLQPCGDDPISADACRSFQPKIDHIVDTHRAHAEELRAAVAALERSAAAYGYTDQEIATALGREIIDR